MMQELITIEEARMHLRLGDDSTFDADVKLKLEGAISIAESYLNRILRQQELSFCLPVSDAILPSVPVDTITSVSYEYDDEDVVLDESDYLFENDEYRPRILILKELPVREVIVKALCGYTQDTLPHAIKMAILFLLGTLYDNESDNLVGRSVSQLPLSVEKILAPWRIEPY